MGPEQRAELSRITEFKKQMGQFNRVGQINCNMFWLPELGSSQIYAQGINGGLGQDESPAASSSSSLLAAGDEPVV